MDIIWTLWSKFRRWRWKRKCIKYFGCEPETIYVSQEDYDALIDRINSPPDPKVVERLREIMSKKAPWEE